MSWLRGEDTPGQDTSAVLSHLATLCLFVCLSYRESLYRLLPQTTPENMQKNITLFSVDPTTRYVNTSLLTVTPAQVNTEREGLFLSLLMMFGWTEEFKAESINK